MIHIGVVVRDIEDGLRESNFPAVLGTVRPAAFRIGTVILDWVEVFDNSGQPPIATTGTYNESDTDGIDPLLLLEPADRWRTFINPAFSEQSFVGAATTTGALDSIAAGQAASLHLNIEEGDATTAIFDAGNSIGASNQLLALCQWA